MGALKLLALLGLCAVSIAACVPARDAYYRDLTRAMQTRRFADANAQLHKASANIYGERDKLLEPLDAAMVAFAAGDYPRSISACESAKRLADNLYTKHVGEHVEAYLFGDDRLPYVGEPFERVAIHLIEALAYAGQGQLSESRVEARALQATLRAQVKRDDPRLGGRHEDAFAHLLSGLLAQGDVGNLTHEDDATLELAAALRAYEAQDAPRFATAPPKVLYSALCPLLAGAAGVSRRERFADAAQACDGRAASVDGGHGAAAEPMLRAANHVGKGHGAAPPTKEAKVGRVVLIHLAGEVPAKWEADWLAPVGLSIVRVPYATYGPPQVRAGHLRLRVGAAGPWREAELVHNLGAIARATLRAHADAVHDRAVARAVAAALASDALIVGGAVKGGTAGGIMELVGLGVGIASAATNHADTRSWRTLPDRIELVAFTTPAGPTSLEVTVQGAGGGRSFGERLELDVPAGATRFVVVRTL